MMPTQESGHLAGSGLLDASEVRGGQAFVTSRGFLSLLWLPSGTLGLIAVLGSRCGST